MGEAAMPPEVAVTDGEVEANYIRIRNHGANGTDDPARLGISGR